MKLNRSYLWTVTLILTVIGFIYWRVFHYPFIYDDWAFLHSILFKGSLRYLLDEFSPMGKIIYRPFGALYFVTLYGLSGVNPLGLHISALLIHFCNSLFVVMIVHHISRDFFQASAVGILYAASVTVHMEPLLWLAGFYDVGGAFLFLLSILFFIKNMRIPSLATFCLALMTKEATIIIPAILVLFLLTVRTESGSPSFSSGKFLFRSFPYFVILGLYAAVKYCGISPLSVPEDNPLKVAFIAPQLVDNCLTYMRWAFDAICPIREQFIAIRYLIVGVVGILLFAVSYLSTMFFYRRQEIFRTMLRTTMFWLGWLVIGLVPVLFLAHHSARYFFTFSLPAFLVLSYSVFFTLLSTVCRRGSSIKLIIGIVLVINVGSSAYYYWQKDNESPDLPAREGNYNLVQKGKMVNIIRDYLLQRYSDLPRHSILIGDCLNLRAIAYGYALQVWYHDTTLSYYDLNDVKSDSVGLYVRQSAAYPQRIDNSPRVGSNENLYLDGQKTFLFVYYQGTMANPDVSVLFKGGEVHAAQE